ncbi:hypothetical protein T492DRAFT_831556 [Pavlovales sp. CCMP2436]|nr:hypothetical protein T492DRAFT_831556 [Pavlovales sp. CCMP2436]
MKLGCFTSVNPDGSTRILAGSIIMQLDGARDGAGALAWLRKIYERREKWAYRYTWSYFTAGANSSQVGVDQTLLLVDLIKYVEKYEEIKEIRNELKETRIAVKHYCNTTSELPIVQKLIQDGTIMPYAVECVKAQAVLSLTYQAHLTVKCGDASDWRYIVIYPDHKQVFYI